jgi:hypothetical protein
MKMIKIALLATAALTAVSMSARADDLSDLKAQIAALNAQVAATADVPAAGPTVTWSGNVKAALTYVDKVAGVGPAATATAAAALVNPKGFPIDITASTYTDVQAKYGLGVTATNETAVGTVGVNIAFAGNSGGVGVWNTTRSLSSDGYKGWWSITPELTLMAGSQASLSGNGEGFDGRATAHFFGGDFNGGYAVADPVAQMRLSYSSGPISAAVDIEDGQNLAIAPFNVSKFGVAGEIKYAGDAFGAELNGGMQGHVVALEEDSWTVNAGAHIALGDMGTLSAAAGMGSGFKTDDDYTRASAFVNVVLGDSAHAELGVSHNWNTQAGNTNSDATAFGGGLYYSPVSQLTIGLEGDYASSVNYGKRTRADLVTVFSF